MINPSNESTSDLAIYAVCAYGYTWLSGVVALLLDLPWEVVTVVVSPGPLIGAVLVTLRTKGRAGLRDFFVRAFRWRFNPIWYVLALLIPFAVFVARSGAAIFLGGADAPGRWFSPSFSTPFLVSSLIWNGIGEEMGWRSFALPRLQQRFGSLAGSIFLGVIWAFWHLPAFIIPGSSQHGDSLLEYVLLLVSWTIIMAMLYNKAGGSVLVAIILHETQNFIAFTMNLPSGAGIYALPLWLLFALLSIPLLPRPLARMGRLDSGNPSDSDQNESRTLSER